MKNTKNYLSGLIIAAMFFFAFATKSYAHKAGGFPVRPGSLLLSPSVNYFFATKGWDSLRRLTPFIDNGRFQSIGYSLYTEYGISKRITLVASLPYITSSYTNSTGYSSQNNGFTDLEAGLRYYIGNINYIYYFSVQGTAIIPLYSNNPNLGYGEPGAEVKASFGGSGHFIGRNYYFTVENGVRQYFGNGGPLQDRYTATVGLTLDKRYRHQFSVSLGGFYSTSSLSSSYDPTRVAANKNFAFNQVSLSYGYSVTRRFSIFLTAGKFINGRNTGDGTSASASFIVKPF
jgi:hypothetical protein